MRTDNVPLAACQCICGGDEALADKLPLAQIGSAKESNATDGKPEVVDAQVSPEVYYKK